MIDEILKCTLVPFAVASVILLLSWRPWKGRDARPPAWGLAACAGFAFIAAELLIRRPAQLWPVDVSQRTIHVALGAMLLSIPAWLAPLWIIRQFVRVLMGAMVVWMLGFSVEPASWGESQLLWALVWTGVLSVFIAGLSAGASRSATVLAPFCLGLIATALALVVFFGASSLALAQSVGSTASVVLVFFLVAVAQHARGRKINVIGPAGDVVACLLASYVLFVYVFYLRGDEPARWSFGLVLASIVPVVLIDRPVLKSRRAWIRWVVVLVPLVAMLGAAVWLAVPADYEPYY